jgi:hypothetical protein
MKKLFFLLVAILFSVVVGAQTDMSGTWVLNKSKSKLGAEFSMAPKDMTVVHKGNDFGYDKHSEWQGQEFTISDKFTLDGKECVNKGWMDTQKKSTAVWSDDKKSLKITSKIPMQDETMTVIELYKMDGGNLVLETKASSSYGDMEETQVFEKK